MKRKEEKLAYVFIDLEKKDKLNQSVRILEICLEVKNVNIILRYTM